MEAVSSDEQELKVNLKYRNRIVAPSLDPVNAIGGFKVIRSRVCRTSMPRLCL